MTRVKWTKEMDDVIREVGQDKTIKEIQREIEDRTGTSPSHNAVRNRKMKLGVRSRINAGWFGHSNGGFKSTAHKEKFLEASKAMRFKKGNVPHKARNLKIGSERLDKDSYIEVKIKEHSTPGKNDCWRGKHLVIWEKEHNKKVPPGHVVIFVDHDKRNFDPSNLALVKRRYMSIINKLHIKYHDSETLQVAIGIAELKYQQTQARRRPRSCKQCGATFKPEFDNQTRCRACINANKRKRRRT